MDNLSGSGKWCVSDVKSVEVVNTSTDETPIEITPEEFEARLAIIEDLADELEAIENELATLSIQPKPSQKAMNLYIHSLKIENCLNANKKAFLSAIDTIKGKLEEINEQKKELTLESDKALRRRVFQDSVNWTNVLERYIIN